jgi:predicted RNA polymerase sigma factor
LAKVSDHAEAHQACGMVIELERDNAVRRFLQQAQSKLKKSDSKI